MESRMGYEEKDRDGIGEAQWDEMEWNGWNEIGTGIFEWNPICASVCLFSTCPSICSLPYSFTCPRFCGTTIHNQVAASSQAKHLGMLIKTVIHQDATSNYMNLKGVCVVWPRSWSRSWNA